MRPLVNPGGQLFLLLLGQTHLGDVCSHYRTRIVVTLIIGLGVVQAQAEPYILEAANNCVGSDAQGHALSK